MTDLGFTNKELSDTSYYGAPCCASETDKGDWEKQTVYPEIRFNGKVAEALGAEDLDLDEMVELTVKLRVKSLRNEGRVVDGEKKRDVEICFEVLAASDFTAASDDSEDESESEGSGLHETMGEIDDEQPVDSIL